MPLHVIVHHRRDSNQPWVNSWLDDNRLEAIQTTLEVARLCRNAHAKDATVFVHRCAFGGDAPLICCSLKVDTVDRVASSTWLVKFKDQRPIRSVPPIQAAQGQNSYVM